jgi:ATP-binding cassette subfamily B protein
VSFPLFQQHDAMDCGPTCLRMITRFYGKHYSAESLREKAYITREGVSLLGISEAAEKIGYKTLAIKLNAAKLIEEAPLPCILHWNQNHFVVLYKVSKPLLSFLPGAASIDNTKFHIADPAGTKVVLNKVNFDKHWTSGHKEGEGIALLLEPANLFYEQEDDKRSGNRSAKFILGYIKPFKKYLFNLLFAMFIASLLELIFPFLTQSMVDNGIINQNIGFVYIILISQVMLFAGKTVVEMIRSWLLLHISARINISIISDFITKLMKLPLSFFDTKLMGDITQRISDHYRIQQFLTSSSLSTIFSMVNLVIFSGVMAYYNIPILIFFFVGSLLSIAWVVLFLRWRKNIDYAHFAGQSENQNQIFEIINGMAEIKLSNAELQERWTWERIQARLFKIDTQSLTLEQWQMDGSRFITQFKNIIISFLSAKAVIDGQMSLGMMMAVSYIIGQMNGPIEQLIGFFRSAQDAAISLERMKEIHDKKDEEPPIPQEGDRMVVQHALTFKKGKISIKDLSFTYNPLDTNPIFNNLTVEIPEGKITAIVGTSGSGKTTLLKLILKFYDLKAGEILVGNQKLASIPANLWRSKCGVVMQDGYIFGKTIAENIALGAERLDFERLRHASMVANILEYIEELPLGFNTKIGSQGSNLSQGQKQRMLIARAVYKNPDYIFFDEATSALDANNESVIMKNLDEFFKGKTVIVVAHRLSTVKNADKIVVLDKGKLIEEGTHAELTAAKGSYYKLVKNQLELGN